MNSLRHTVRIATLLSLVLSTQGGLVTHVLFQLRQAYIAEHLCENRFDEHRHCHGKCFLKKRMADAEEHREESTLSAAPSPISVFALTESEEAPPQPVDEHRYADTYAVQMREGHPSPLDHPPRLG